MSNLSFIVLVYVRIKHVGACCYKKNNLQHSGVMCYDPKKDYFSIAKDPEVFFPTYITANCQQSQCTIYS